MSISEYIECIWYSKSENKQLRTFNLKIIKV